MNEAEVLEVGREAVFVVLQIAGPLLLTGMLIGLIIAFIQALTTIQEMTLTFVPKILVIFIAMILFLPFMMTTLIDFSRGLFDRIVALG